MVIFLTRVILDQVSLIDHLVASPPNPDPENVCFGLCLSLTRDPPDSSCRIFAVTVSSQVRAGAQETLCAQIHGSTEPITLTVALHVDAAETVLLEEAGITQDFYRCLTFQVLTPHRVQTHTNQACVLVFPL